VFTACHVQFGSGPHPCSAGRSGPVARTTPGSGDRRRHPRRRWPYAPIGPTGRAQRPRHALDRDPAAIAAAEANLAGLPVVVSHASFADLPEVLEQLEIPAVNGVLLDLGLSSDQLADPERGFSFTSQGALDLRFDPTAGEPAWRLLNRLSAEHLADLIYAYGEERYSRQVARAIVESGTSRRSRQPPN